MQRRCECNIYDLQMYQRMHRSDLIKRFYFKYFLSTAYLLVIDCGPPTSKPSATILFTNLSTLYNSTVVYECITGYWYLPGITVQTSICNATGNWTTIDNCTGIFSLILLLSVINLFSAARKKALVYFVLSGILVYMYIMFWLTHIITGLSID